LPEASDHHVGTATVGAIAHPTHARGGVDGLAHVEHVIGPEPPRLLEPRARGAGDEHAKRSGELREDRRVQAHGPAPLHDHAVAERDARALDRVEPSRQAAPAAHELLDREALGQRQDAHCRLELDPFGPAAEDTVRDSGRDAVDLPLGAARGRFRHQAVPARAAGPVDVVKRHESAHADFVAERVVQRAVGLEHTAHAHVAGDDRVRDTGEPAVVEVHVGPAHLARHHFEDRAAGRGPRRVEPPQLERCMGGGHHDGADRIRHALTRTG